MKNLSIRNFTEKSIRFIRVFPIVKAVLKEAILSVYST